MISWLMRPWFQARALGVLQTYYNQPLKNPLPPFEARILRGAVNLTMTDGGTPFDAATRFYAAYAETAVGQGRSLNDIGFGFVLGRLSALRDKMKFYDEHIAMLKTVSVAGKGNAPLPGGSSGALNDPG